MTYDLIVFTENPLAYAPKRILEECKKKRISALAISYKNIDFSVKSSGVTVTSDGSLVPTAKIVLFRELNPKAFAYYHRNYLINYYLAKGSYVINSKSYLKWPYLDKLTQHFEMQKARIPFVETLDFGHRKRLIEAMRGKYPFIEKYHISSRGREVFKVNGPDDVEKINKLGYKTRTLLVQELQKAGEDLRIIVINGQILGAMKRIANTGSHLTNFSQGGRVEPYDLSADEKASEIAKKCAEHFMLDYVGVDLMRGNDEEWKVLEVNRGAQFKGFELATGLNVAKTVVDAFLLNG